MKMKPMYDGYRIAGCQRFDEGPDSLVVECEDRDAQFWTIYGYIDNRSLDNKPDRCEAIGDFRSREAAEEVYFHLAGEKFHGSGEPDDRVRMAKAAPILYDALADATAQLEAYELDLFGDNQYYFTAQYAALELARPTGRYPATGHRFDTVTNLQIDGILADRRQIAVICDTGCVRLSRPDLSRDEAWEVLQHAKLSILSGISGVLDRVAEQLFPLPQPMPDGLTDAAGPVATAAILAADSGHLRTSVLASPAEFAGRAMPSGTAQPEPLPAVRSWPSPGDIARGEMPNRPADQGRDNGPEHGRSL